MTFTQRKFAIKLNNGFMAMLQRLFAVVV